MPVEFEMSFLGVENGKNPQNPVVIHGMFFNLLGQLDKKLTNMIHPQRTKVFTLYPIPDGVRITLLDDGVAERIFHLSMRKNVNIYLGRHKVIIREVKIKRFLSFEEILARADIRDKIKVEFISPTTFSQEDIDLPLPVPYLVFRSWIERWNEFSPVKIPDYIKNEIEKIKLSFCDIRTKVFHFGKVRIVGFVGSCTFNISCFDSETKKYLNALADFSYFCGTGKKTTFGMGFTVRSY